MNFLRVSILSLITCYVAHTHTVWTETAKTAVLVLQNTNVQNTAVMTNRSIEATYNPFISMTQPNHDQHATAHRQLANNHQKFVLQQIAELCDIQAILSKQLTDFQIKCLAKLTRNQWILYLNNTLVLQNSRQIFQLYHFYQFPEFREAIRTLQGYDQAMVALYNQLNVESITFDQNLHDRLAYTSFGTNLYECLYNNAAVQATIKEQAIKFADQLSRCTIEEQVEKVKMLEVAQNRHELKLSQMETEINRLKTCSSAYDRNHLAHLVFSRNVAQLQLELINQQILQSKTKMANWKTNLSQTLQGKSVKELQEMQANITANITATYQTLNRLKIDYQKALLENSNLQRQQGLFKTNFKEDKLDPLQQKQRAAIAKLNCLKEQYEQVQVHEYLAQNKNEHYQERLDALQEKSVAQTVTLTDKAQTYLDKLGVDPKALLYKPANNFQVQSQQEVISILNQIADHKEQYANTKVDSLFDASAQLARAALNASKYNNAIKTWTLLDASRDLCDVAKYGAQKLAQAAEWVALHPGQANEAVGNFAKGVLITGPAQSIAKVVDTAEYVANNPKQAAKNCAKVLGRLVVLMGYADSLMANDSQGIHHFDYKDLESLGFNLGEQKQALNELTQTTAQLSLNERCEQAGAFVGEFIADCIILDGTLKVVGNVGKLVTSEATALLRKTKGLEPLHALAKSEQLVVDAGHGLTLALETKQSELASIVKNTVLQNATHEIELIGFESPSLITAQEIADLEAACHSLEHECAKHVSVKVASPELQTKVAEHLKRHCESFCKEHKLILLGKDPARQYHLIIPEELKAVISTEKDWEKLVKIFDGTIVTPAEWGKQPFVWHDYQHMMSPIINRDCKTGKAFLQGFHHDYLGKVQESGLIQFTEIIERPHGFYQCSWQYGNIKSKFSSYFPKHWTPNKVMSKVKEALRNPIGTPEFENGKWLFSGRISEGIVIDIVFDTNMNAPTGKIITAYPNFKKSGGI